MIKVMENVWNTLLRGLISMGEARAKQYLDRRYNHYM